MFNPKKYYFDKMSISSYVDIELLDNITSVSVQLWTRRDEGYILTFGGKKQTQKNYFSNILSADTPQKFFRLQVVGNRLVTEIYKIIFPIGSIINEGVLGKLNFLEEISVIGNDGQSKLTGDWSLNLPNLKLIDIKNHKSPFEKVYIKFTRSNVLPALESLYFSTVDSCIQVEGELQYLPRTLRNISSGAYTNDSGFTGKLSDFPLNIQNIDLPYQNGNDIKGYNSRSWSSLNLLYLRNISLTSAELDQLLIDLANTMPNDGKVKFSNLRPGCIIGVRTPASDGAVQTLKAKNITLNIPNNTF